MGRRNMRVITKPVKKGDVGKVWVYLSNFTAEHNRLPRTEEMQESFPHMDEWALHRITESFMLERHISL